MGEKTIGQLVNLATGEKSEEVKLEKIGIKNTIEYRPWVPNMDSLIAEMTEISFDCLCRYKLGR